MVIGIPAVKYITFRPCALIRDIISKVGDAQTISHIGLRVKLIRGQSLFIRTIGGSTCFRIGAIITRKGRATGKFQVVFQNVKIDMQRTVYRNILVTRLTGISIIIGIITRRICAAHKCPSGGIVRIVPCLALETIILIGEIESASIRNRNSIRQCISISIRILLVKIGSSITGRIISIEIHGSGRTCRQEGVQKCGSGTTRRSIVATCLMPVVLGRPGLAVLGQSRAITTGEGFIVYPTITS